MGNRNAKRMPEQRGHCEPVGNCAYQSRFESALEQKNHSTARQSQCNGKACGHRNQRHSRKYLDFIVSPPRNNSLTCELTVCLADT